MQKGGVNWACGLRVLLIWALTRLGSKKGVYVRLGLDESEIGLQGLIGLREGFIIGDPKLIPIK